jgi:hypothetical protein
MPDYKDYINSVIDLINNSGFAFYHDNYFERFAKLLLQLIKILTTTYIIKD